MTDLIRFSVKEMVDAFGSEVLGWLVDSVLIASVYEVESYEGSAFVLFEKGGKLYEVNGSHCSCYGLEDQWEPTETTWKALAMRKFCCYPEDWSAELLSIVKGRANDNMADKFRALASDLLSEADDHVNEDVNNRDKDGGFSRYAAGCEVGTRDAANRILAILDEHEE